MDQEKYKEKLKEAQYFGSDINKFCKEKVTKRITVNNIDCVIYKYFKDGEYRMRVIESKHTKEKFGNNQKSILNIFQEKGIETYSIRGEYPFEKCDVYSFKTKETKEITKQTLIDFLEFKIEFDNFSDLNEIRVKNNEEFFNSF